MKRAATLELLILRGASGILMIMMMMMMMMPQ
jgi:hypothetical protein